MRKNRFPLNENEPIKWQVLKQLWPYLLEFKGRVALALLCLVAANGKLHLCLFSEQGIDMRYLLANGDVVGLQQFLVECLGEKHATHFLHEGNTGATKHLAMLGG